MKLKLHYIAIPACVFLVLWCGYIIIQQGIAWYETELLLPPLTPPNWIFSTVWAIIALCTTISLLLFFNATTCNWLTWIIGALFILNGGLNLSWSILFFSYHMILASWWVTFALELNILLLMALLWRTSKSASLLLVPYALLLLYALYLINELWLIHEAL